MMYDTLLISKDVEGTFGIALRDGSETTLLVYNAKFDITKVELRTDRIRNSYFRSHIWKISVEKVPSKLAQAAIKYILGER